MELKVFNTLSPNIMCPSSACCVLASDHLPFGEEGSWGGGEGGGERGVYVLGKTFFPKPFNFLTKRFYDKH